MVTHIHPDHYGLAGRVREASGAWVGLHPADAALLQARYVDTDDLVERMVGLLAESGVPDDKRPDLAHASMEIRSLVSMAEPDVLLEDDQKLELPGWDLRTIWTPGHSPGHICLYSDQHRLLLSGDHVLPRITPNISFHSQQDANPLGDYLESLARMRYLDPEEVLPAHEYRFADLGARLAEIERHHADRLDAIEAALADQPGRLVLGPDPRARVVAALGRDPGLHAAGRQRRDPGPPRAARGPGPGPPGGRRPGPLLPGRRAPEPPRSRGQGAGVGGLGHLDQGAHLAADEHDGDHDRPPPPPRPGPRPAAVETGLRAVPAR